MLEKVDSLSKPLGENDVLNSIKLPKSPYRATWANQFSACLRRAFLVMIRDPLVTATKIGQSIFFAVIIGLIYFNMGGSDDIYAVVQNTSGALFVAITNTTFSNMFPVVTIFSMAMPLFLREHWNGLYRTDVFFLARNLVELPINILSPAFYSAVVYYLAGLRPQFQYFIVAMIIIIIIGNIGVSYGYMISCMSSDYNIAILLSTPLTFPLLLFGGIYIQVETIPVWLNWLSYFSWFMYGFELLSINEWKDRRYVNETLHVEVPIGDIVLEKLGFEINDFTIDIVALFVLLFLYRFIAYLLLLSKTYRKQ